ncbi:unnamed protein product [Gadus morhua 'NCC']
MGGIWSVGVLTLKGLVHPLPSSVSTTTSSTISHTSNHLHPHDHHPIDPDHRLPRRCHRSLNHIHRPPTIPMTLPHIPKSSLKPHKHTYTFISHSIPSTTKISSTAATSSPHHLHHCHRHRRDPCPILLPVSHVLVPSN